MNPVTCTKQSGTCAQCQDRCTQKPGWFLPGEAEAAARLLGMTMDDFFRAYLAVDWWESAEWLNYQEVFLLSPAIRGKRPGTEMPGDPRGSCVFYENGRCRIHAAKPHECREALCTDPHDDGAGHRDTAEAWTHHQDQIRALLGREPEAEPFDGDGMFGLFSDLGLG
jgi:Fe-S-cluster containining protein